MDPWVIWIIVAMVLGVADLVTGGSLVLLMLAGGAVAGGVTAALTENDFLPWLAFSLVSLGLLGGVRPLAKRHMRQPAALRSGVDRLVGADAVVVEPVDARDGRVKLSGEVWSARSFDGQSTYNVGDTVQVLEISGATALVA